MQIDIFGDSEGSKAIVDSPSSASRSKHIDAKFHFVLRFEEIIILHVGMEAQHAVVLMKDLWRNMFIPEWSSR